MYKLTEKTPNLIEQLEFKLTNMQNQIEKRKRLINNYYDLDLNLLKITFENLKEIYTSKLNQQRDVILNELITLRNFEINLVNETVGLNEPGLINKLEDLEIKKLEFKPRVKSFETSIELLLNKDFQLKKNFNFSQLVKYRNFLSLNKYLDEKRQDLNFTLDRDFYCKTPLITAIEKGDLEAVRLLVENGANVNYRDTDYNTALIKATQNNNVHIVKLLFSFGADCWVFSELRVPHTDLIVSQC